jgi:hypothetical protein
VPCEVAASKSRISLSESSSQDKQATRKESGHVSVSVPRRHDRRKDGQGMFIYIRATFLAPCLLRFSNGVRAMATHDRSLLYSGLCGWIFRKLLDCTCYMYCCPIVHAFRSFAGVAVEIFFLRHVITSLTGSSPDPTPASHRQCPTCGRRTVCPSCTSRSFSVRWSLPQSP